MISYNLISCNSDKNVRFVQHLNLASKELKVSPKIKTFSSITIVCCQLTFAQRRNSGSPKFGKNRKEYKVKVMCTASYHSSCGDDVLGDVRRIALNL